MPIFGQSRKSLRHERTSFSAKIFAGFVLAGTCLVSPNEAGAQILGTAETYGVLAGTTVTNTGTSVIEGNVGVFPGLAVVGFPPGIVVPPGVIHAGDAHAQQAQTDLTTAYNALQALPSQVNLTGQDLGGLLLGPAVYTFDTSAQLTGVLTLDGQGNSASQFVFQIGSTLTTASNSAVLLINGANGDNVYWAVGSSATLGTDTMFAGNILALTSITLNTGATITCGRALAQNGAVTLDTNTITLCAQGDGGDITEDELGGEGVAGAQQTAFGASRLFGAAVMAQAGYWLNGGGPDFTGITPQTYGPMKLGGKLGGVANEEERALYSGYQPRTWRLWTAGFGGTSSFQGDGYAGSPDLSTRTIGLGVGLDYQVDRTLLVGVAGGYTYSPFSVDTLPTSGTVEGGHFALYGVKRVGQLYLAGIADYELFYNKSERSIDWVVNEQATGKFSGDGFYGRLETGWRKAVGDHWVTPFAGIDLARFRFGNFTEESDGILGLTFDSSMATSVVSSLGVQFDTRLALSNGQWLRPFARVAWAHEFNPERGVDSSLTLAPVVAFSLEDVFTATDVAKVDAGLMLDLTANTGVFAYFNGEFADNIQSYAGNAGVRVLW